MRYCTQEYNDRLLLEFEYSKGFGEVTNGLKLLFLYLAIDTTEKEKYRYSWMSEDDWFLSIICAYEACMKHGLKFNERKNYEKNNAYGYVSTIIRSSFANTIQKQYKKKRIIPVVNPIKVKKLNEGVPEKEAPPPPLSPLGRVLVEGVIPTCPICHSSMVRKVFLSRERKCANPKCPNSNL